MLRSLVRDSDEDVRLMACAMLAAIDPEAVDAAEAFLQLARKGEISEMEDEWLGLVSRPALIPRLIKALREDDVRVRLAVVRVLRALAEGLTQTDPTEKELRAKGPLVRALLDRFGMLLILPVLLGLGGILSPAFVSADNLSNLLLQFAPLAIVAMGQAFVMIARGLDLSVASMMATAAVIATSFSGSDRDVAAIFAVALTVAVMIGLLNGFLVTKRQVSPFLATLATMIVCKGVALIGAGLQDHATRHGFVPNILDSKR